jgi:hypothetical protein
MVGGAGSTQPVRTLAQCTARVQESCAPLMQRFACRLILAGFLLALLFGIEGEGNTFLL